MTNFAITQQESLDSVNYLLSGPSSIGNNLQGFFGDGFAYFPGQGGEPYAQTTQPLTPPLTNQYLETDTFVVVNVTDPTQKIAVSGQMKLWASWTVSVPSNYDIFIALNRYKLPNILYYPTTLTELNITFTNFDILPDDPAEGEIITVGSSGMVFANYIDEPGELGTYYYWMEVFLLPISGDMVIDWIGADYRSVTASLIQTPVLKL
jgi:hypothetical protein